MASVALRTEQRKINSCSIQFDGLAVLPQLFGLSIIAYLSHFNRRAFVRAIVNKEKNDSRNQRLVQQCYIL